MTIVPTGAILTVGIGRSVDFSGPKSARGTPGYQGDRSRSSQLRHWTMWTYPIGAVVA